MQKTGFQCLAFVISDDIIIKNVTLRLMEVIGRLNLDAEIFTDLDKANIWLMEKVKT